MRTWILCIDKAVAKVFAKEGTDEQPRLCYTLKSSHRSKTNFLKYVAEEMELAAGAGTDNQLEVYGEADLLKKLTKKFSHEVRHSIRQSVAIGA